MKAVTPFLVLALCSCVTPLCAAQLVETAPALPVRETTPSIWQDDQIGTGFRRGTSQAGISLEGGFGMEVFGASEAHDMALGRFHYGCMLSDVVAKEQWYRGNWELLVEAFGGLQHNPRNHYVAGVTPVLRYNFITGTRWVPFFDGAAGVAATDIGEPDLGSVFEFSLYGGPGVHYFVNKNTALTLQYKYMHLSNAGTRFPNVGVNASMFSLGLTVFF